MEGVRLVVAYDGTRFAGWQSQPAQRTVQVELERAISAIAKAPIKVRGASRTDSGVHALHQIVAFDTERKLPPYRWVRGLNGKLDVDVAVVRAEPCEPGENPRYGAMGKTYRYLVHTGSVRDPLLTSRAWHLGPRRSRPHRGERIGIRGWLDVEAMHEAAARLVGEHDFAAFQAAGDPRENTIRCMERVEVITPYDGREDLIAIEVKGNAFLQHMVRIMAGTIVEAGRERMSPDEVSALLTSARDRAAAGETAPAHGLYLIDIALGRPRPAWAVSEP